MRGRDPLFHSFAVENTASTLARTCGLACWPPQSEKTINSFCANQMFQMHLEDRLEVGDIDCGFWIEHIVDRAMWLSCSQNLGLARPPLQSKLALLAGGLRGSLALIFGISLTDSSLNRQLRTRSLSFSISFSLSFFPSLSPSLSFPSLPPSLSLFPLSLSLSPSLSLFLACSLSPSLSPSLSVSE